MIITSLLFCDKCGQYILPEFPVIKTNNTISYTHPDRMGSCEDVNKKFELPYSDIVEVK